MVSAFHNHNCYDMTLSPCIEDSLLSTFCGVSSHFRVAWPCRALKCSIDDCTRIHVIPYCIASLIRHPRFREGHIFASQPNSSSSPPNYRPSPIYLCCLVFSRNSSQVNILVFMTSRSSCTSCIYCYKLHLQIYRSLLSRIFITCYIVASNHRLIDSRYDSHPKYL